MPFKAAIVTPRRLVRLLVSELGMSSTSGIPGGNKPSVNRVGTLPVGRDGMAGMLLSGREVTAVGRDGRAETKCVGNGGTVARLPTGGEGRAGTSRGINGTAGRSPLRERGGSTGGVFNGRDGKAEAPFNGREGGAVGPPRGREDRGEALPRGRDGSAGVPPRDLKGSAGVSLRRRGSKAGTPPIARGGNVGAPLNGREGTTDGPLNVDEGAAGSPLRGGEGRAKTSSEGMGRLEAASDGTVRVSIEGTAGKPEVANEGTVRASSQGVAVSPISRDGRDGRAGALIKGVVVD